MQASRLSADAVR